MDRRPEEGFGNFVKFTKDSNIGGESEFEVSFEDIQNDEQKPYFDGEHVFHNINIDCCIDNSDNGSPFEAKIKNMEDISCDGGVYKKIKKTGSGEIVPKEALVKVHYNAYIEFSDEPFDSTRLRNDPLKFRLGLGDVVLGLDLAVSTMRKGEFSEFIFFPSYFMGEMGVPPRIPPEAIVMFQIELLTYFGNNENLLALPEKEQKCISFDQLLLDLKSEREQGNELFKQQKYDKALSKYTKSFHILDTYKLFNELEEKLKNQEILKVYLNISQCHLKLSQPRQAYYFAKKALELDEKSAKALFRCGKALLELSEFKNARNFLLKAQKIEPNNSHVLQTITKLEKLSSNYSAVEKIKYSKLFTSDCVKPPTFDDTKLNNMGINEIFKKKVKEQFMIFKNNSDARQESFSILNFTKEEVQHVIDLAKLLGLIVKQIPYDNDHLEILKS